MDYDVIYVDEGRNAIVNDHRTGRPGQWRPLPSRPSSGSRTVVVPPGARPTVITGTASGYHQPTAYYPPAYAPAPSFASRFGTHGFASVPVHWRSARNSCGALPGASIAIL